MKEYLSSYFLFRQKEKANLDKSKSLGYNISENPYPLALLD